MRFVCRMDDHRVPMNGMPTLDPSLADLNHFQRDLRPTDKLCFGHRRHTVRPQSSLHPHHRVIVHTTDNSSSSNSSCCSSNASTNSSFSITPSFLTTKSVASSLLSSMPTSSSSSSNRRRRRMLDTQPSHLLVGNRTCISGHSTLFSPLVILCVILCCMQRTVVPVEAHFATLLPPSTTTPVDPYGPLREKESKSFVFICFLIFPSTQRPFLPSPRLTIQRPLPPPTRLLTQVTPTRLEPCGVVWYGMVRGIVRVQNCKWNLAQQSWRRVASRRVLHIPITAPTQRHLCAS